MIGYMTKFLDFILILVVLVITLFIVVKGFSGTLGSIINVF